MNPDLVEALTDSRRFGYLGPGPVEAHLHHASAFADATEPPARALDLGAGGGLPGLVLATDHWPDTRWTFLDSQVRRTDFLRQQVEALGLAHRVEVITVRAEEAGRDPAHRGSYDLVVARSFGAPSVTAECSAPLLATGGWLVVSEPPEGDVAQRWPAEAMGQLGFGLVEALEVPTPSGPVHLMRARLVDPVDDRFPRRVGVPAKRPLF